jgi:hypothetical protein
LHLGFNGSVATETIEPPTIQQYKNMNQSCAEISKFHDSFIETKKDFETLYSAVRSFEYKENRTLLSDAIAKKSRLEELLVDLKRRTPNNVYFRKKLAEDAGLIYIGPFDKSGRAFAWESRDVMRFVDRRGKLIMPKNVQAETPFKDGYAVITRFNTMSAIDQTLRKQKDFKVQFLHTNPEDWSAVFVRIINKNGKVIEWSHGEFLGKLEVFDDSDGIRHFIEKDENGVAVIDMAR